MALGDIHLLFVWQAWHLWHWAGSGGALGPVLVAGDAAALCVAGVALGDIHRRFTWQVWHLATTTFVLRGRRGTYGSGLAEVARLGPFWSPVTPAHFAWQAWHLATSTVVSRGRRGTWRQPPLFCVAGVALGDIHLRFTWQAWHLATATWRGTYGTGLVLVARLGPFWSPVTPRHFAWQAWHLVTSTFVSRGRCGTWRHLPSFCVAGVAPSLTHPLSHTTLSHTIFHTPSFAHTVFHTQLCHPPSFTHHLSHTTLSPTIFDTPSFTHNFVTHHL